MNWLQPAIIATVTNISILAVVYLYLYLKERDRSLLLFFISWCFYSLRLLLMLAHIHYGGTVLLVLNQACVILSSHLLFVAFNIWLKKPAAPLAVHVASGLCLLWVFALGASDLPFTTFTLPVFFYVGGLYIAIGVQLLRSSRRSIAGVRIVAVSLLIWGIHKIDYPFLRPIEWLAPWGYLLAGVTTVLTAIGMILIYFETAKLRLHDLVQEKEILLREVHHRVKNNLSILHSLLRHHLDAVDSPATAEILKKLEDKIFAFVLIHSLLHRSESVERIDFKEYLRSFARHLVASYGESEESLSFDLQVDPLEMDINHAKSLGLIANELITNSLKHAFHEGDEKRIEISIEKLREGFFRLRVRDNGIGLPQEMKIDDPKMSGLYLVKMLCKEIDGSLEYNGARGAEMTVSFSLEPAGV